MALVRFFNFSLLVVCTTTLVLAQAPEPDTEPVPNATQDEVEQLDDGSLEEEEGEGAADLERIAEARAYYVKHPIDLNSATRESFAALNLLNPAQVNAILDHRATSGDFISPLELQSVRSLSIDEVRLLLQYVTVKDGVTSTVKSIKARIKDAAGFIATRSAFQTTTQNTDNWLGPRLPLYIRARWSAGRQFSAGIVVENDAGEPYGGKNNPLLFDYVNAHIYADELPGVIKTVALGDYGVNWGQGLITYTGFGTGKGAFVMDVQRNPRWIIPHASVREVGFYRGAAVAAEVGPFKLMGMASRTRPDGAIDTLSDDEFEFSSFRLSGLHRTANEIAGRRSNTATTFGGAVSWDQKWGRISLHHMQHQFEVPFVQGGALYQNFNISSDRLANTSLAWQTFLGPVSWFGEAAVDVNNQSALLTGVQIGLDRKTDMSIVYRRYDVGYRTLYNNVFGTSRRPENEEGIYFGVRMQLAKRWVLQGFGDLFIHPFARFRSSTPTSNQDGLLRITYEKRRKHSVYFQLRHRDSERDLSRSESATLRTIEPFVRTAARVQGQVVMSKQVTLRARVEFARTNAAGWISEGTVVYQDLILKPSDFPVSLTARVALIDTDDYESRIYAYENDLLYRFRIPAYYGTGYRGYVNLRWRASRKLTAELRGALGRREGADDQIEVATQLRYKF